MTRRALPAGPIHPPQIQYSHPILFKSPHECHLLRQDQHCVALPPHPIVQCKGSMQPNKRGQKMCHNHPNQFNSPSAAPLAWLGPSPPLPPAGRRSPPQAGRPPAAPPAVRRWHARQRRRTAAGHRIAGRLRSSMWQMAGWWVGMFRADGRVVGCSCSGQTESRWRGLCRMRYAMRVPMHTASATLKQHNGLNSPKDAEPVPQRTHPSWWSPAGLIGPALPHRRKPRTRLAGRMAQMQSKYPDSALQPTRAGGPNLQHADQGVGHPAQEQVPRVGKHPQAVHLLGERMEGAHGRAHGELRHRSAWAGEPAWRAHRLGHRRAWAGEPAWRAHRLGHCSAWAISCWRASVQPQPCLFLPLPLLLPGRCLDMAGLWRDCPQPRPQPQSTQALLARRLGQPQPQGSWQWENRPKQPGWLPAHLGDKTVCRGVQLPPAPLAGQRDEQQASTVLQAGQGLGRATWKRDVVRRAKASQESKRLLALLWSQC